MFPWLLLVFLWKENLYEQNPFCDADTEQSTRYVTHHSFTFIKRQLNTLVSSSSLSIWQGLRLFLEVFIVQNMFFFFDLVATRNKWWTQLKIKKAILAYSSGPQKNLKQLFFCEHSKSKIVASVHCGYASKDDTCLAQIKTKFIFYLIPIETSWHKNH